MTSSHSSFLFVTFVFSPWDLYSLGHKNNNNNDNYNYYPIYKASKASASEALAASQSWVLLKSFMKEVPYVLSLDLKTYSE